MYGFNGRYQKPKILGMPQWTAIGLLVLMLGIAYSFMAFQISWVMLILTAPVISVGIYFIRTGTRRMEQHFIQKAMNSGLVDSQCITFGIKEKC